MGSYYFTKYYLYPSNARSAHGCCSIITQGKSLTSSIIPAPLLLFLANYKESYCLSGLTPYPRQLILYTSSNFKGCKDVEALRVGLCPNSTTLLFICIFLPNILMISLTLTVARLKGCAEISRSLKIQALQPGQTPAQLAFLTTI